jgi:hypothetical protein
MATFAMAKSRTSSAPKISEVNFENDESIVQFVQGRWEKRRYHRQAMERQWYTNVLHFLGYQYHTYDDTTGRFYQPPAPPWRVRYVGNRLLGNVRKIVSKALRQKPNWTSIPATSDLEDQMVSLVSDKVLKAYWRSLDMTRLLTDALYWMGTTGNAFKSIVWDPEIGPELEFNREDLAELPPEMQTPEAMRQIEKLLKGGIRLGDPRVEVHSPFQIEVDPEAMRINEAAWLNHSKCRALSWLKDRYPKEAADLTPESGNDGSLTMFYERRIQNTAGPYGGWNVEDEEAGESILTHNLWLAPSKKHKKGAWALVAGDVVLDKQKELPNPFHAIPYVQLLEIPVPGRFWATCALEHCIGPQGDYNKGRSQLIENRNVMSRPKWAVPKGSGILNSSIDNQPGEVIEHNPGLPPVVITPPAIPDYVHRLLEYALKDIEDVSHIHEVTQSRAPSGVRSGVAIAQLQEQDDQVLAPTFLLMEEALSQLGSWLLHILAENVEEERILKIVGKGNEVETKAFTGKQLYGPNSSKPGVNYFDVQVQLGSQLPLSKQARLQFTIDLVNAGILDRVADKKKILEILELGTEEGVINEEQLDKQAARRENLQLMDGLELEINPWDNDLIHLDQHTLFEKQPDFKKLATPEDIARFETHKARHQLRVQAVMQPQSQGLPPEEQAPEEAEMPLDDNEAAFAAGVAGQEIPGELIGP